VALRLALSRARPEDLLAIHLNDHFALIEGGGRAGPAALRANRGSVLGELLAGLREDVEDDRRERRRWKGGNGSTQGQQDHPHPGTPTRSAQGLGVAS